MSGVEALDFSGLFKLETLVQMDVVASSFYEVGLKKMIALAGETVLEFLYISQYDKSQKAYDWDFTQHPIRCMCFEPSGTWLLLTSDGCLSLVPFMPLFEPKSEYDRKWSLTEATVLPFVCDQPVAVAWWLTKEAENVAIVALRCGIIIFYSLDSKTKVGETKVHGEIADIQMSVDDSLDLLVLLITGTSNQQWKLVLEHRCVEYNWIRVYSGAPAEAKDKKEGLMAYIKEKIATLSIGSNDVKVNAVEYFRDPTDYLPTFRKGSHDWSLSVQYVNGRHFITAFDVKVGTVILESTEEDTPSRTLHPRIKKEANYRQGLWCQKLLFLLTDNAIEVHSASFSVIQSSSQEGTKEDTCLWRTELPSELRRSHLMFPQAANPRPYDWEKPTFLCDLQLPRFTIESCLVLGSKGAFFLTTMLDPCEWIVGMIMRGGRGAERSAAALGAPVDTLLCAAADMLLSRNKLPPAKYLYSLSKGPPDGWASRLGIFEWYSELATYKLPPNSSSSLSRPIVLMRLLAQLILIAEKPEQATELDTQCPNLTIRELEEVCDVLTALGLWGLLPLFSTHRGHPQLILYSMGYRKALCRGSMRFLLKQRYLLPFLFSDDVTFLFDFLTDVDNLRHIDTATLKRIIIWLSPLNEQARPLMRDLKEGLTTIYTSRMIHLIGVFMKLVCELDSRTQTLQTTFASEPTETEVWKEPFVPKRTVSGGLMHWAISDYGDAHVLLVDTPIKTATVGRVVGVACGRHHTIVLTENGVYAAGDNSHGQLGVGERWAGAAGEGAAAGGALLHVRHAWCARVVAVAAGHYHSAALDTGGRLFTWGWGVHGQLGLGNTDDAVRPQLVTKLQGRKVVSVGCGACHTTVLMRNGEVWAFGAGMFGQLGSGGRGKSSVPVRVAMLPDPVEMLAVGYFHNLALTEKGELWTWGASPQCVRSAALHPRRAATPPSDDPPPDAHLHPTPVNMDAIGGGRIVQMSAGWHHSCLLTHNGLIYTWGLNFDGQLGSGDRKQIVQPTQVEIPLETAVDVVNSENVGPPQPSDMAHATIIDRRDQKCTTKAIIACGGDFTVYVDNYGKIYIAGNTHQQADGSKQGNRIIMMKTTRRVIKIPANRSNNQFLFQFFDRFDNFLVFNPDNVARDMIAMQTNPLAALSDFDNEKWLDEILHALKPWINEADVSDNLNVAAKLAYYNKMYSECLKLQLDNITMERNSIEYVHKQQMYPGTTFNPTPDEIRERDKRISKTIGDRIKAIGLAFLKEKPTPDMGPNYYMQLPCSCRELPLLPVARQKSISPREASTQKDNLSCRAAQVLDDSLSRFPASCEAWEEYLGLAKTFFLKNNLPGEELECIMKKYLEGNSSLVSSAVMLSEDCENYVELLTPKFYLSVCNKLLDTWG